ncbi:MAG TPA: AbrB/MazE/SpoVT family DNA-binding domain-containing protein [Caulobacteraceae bacterium]|jgi:antitoxin MazE|nr:AbrB/MazE/SpoVT family DNA-binding domain-containing protein [Caulobacteraceae bacterium]
MRAAIRKMGNSSGVIIPKPLLSELGVETGDAVDMTVEQGRIVLAPVAKHPRAGWAHAAAALAETAEDGLVWPEFANDEDQDLTW